MLNDFRLSESLSHAFQLAREQAARLGQREMCAVEVLCEVIGSHTPRDNNAAAFLRRECPFLAKRLETELDRLRAGDEKGTTFCLVGSDAVLVSAEQERIKRGNIRISNSHFVICCMLAEQRAFEQFGCDVHYCVRYLQVTSGRGLARAELILAPRVRKPIEWDFPADLRGREEVLIALEVIDMLSDDEFQESEFVQIAHGRRLSDAQAVLEEIVRAIVSETLP